MRKQRELWMSETSRMTGGVFSSQEGRPEWIKDEQVPSD